MLETDWVASKRLTCATIALSTMVGLASGAFAQATSHQPPTSSTDPEPDPHTPSPAERETARSAMDEGDLLRESGDLQGALARFVAAHEIMRLPTTGLEVARLQVQLGMLVEARQTALEAAHVPESPGERPVLAQARRAASSLAEEIAPRVPSLTMRVVPPDAPYSITVDGVRLSEASRALPFRCNPGEHEIVVEAAGYQTVTQHVVLLESTDRLAQVSLLPSPRRAETVAAARAVQLQQLTPRRDVPASDDRLRGIVALGVGGATLAAGVVAGMASLVETRNAEGECDGTSCPPRAWNQVENANTLANISNVTIPLGLLAIAYGVYEFASAPGALPAERAQAVRSLVLTVQPEGASATWRGAL
jgi:hypothetical protein